jgi:hypothetical protein
MYIFIYISVCMYIYLSICLSIYVDVCARRGQQKGRGRPECCVGLYQGRSRASGMLCHNTTDIYIYTYIYIHLYISIYIYIYLNHTTQESRTSRDGESARMLCRVAHRTKKQQHEKTRKRKHNKKTRKQTHRKESKTSKPKKRREPDQRVGNPVCRAAGRVAL